MIKNNSSVKTPIINRAKQCFSIIFIIFLANLLSACQMSPYITGVKTDTNHNTIQYSQYYLWLKTLNNKQLLQEEHKQRSIMASEHKNESLSQSKLMLIYSLQNPAIHQPYKAKRLLNEHLLTSNNLSKDNLAFTMLLRDQLNILLRLLEKQALSEQNFIKHSHEHHTKIEQLNQQLKHVNQQLMLLKKIDQNINERG
jgi:hypothetical protein